MFSRVALVVLAVVVVEYLLFDYAVQLLGLSAIVWLSIGAAVVGVLLVRHFVPEVLRGGLQPLSTAARQPSAQSSAQPAGCTVADHALLVVAGFLLIVPGFLTGLVAILLVLPPVRGAVRARVRHSIDSLVSRGLGAPDGLNVSFIAGGRPFGRRDVVDVNLHPDEKVPGDNATDDGSTSAPPELN